jgi:hypothetical protein
MTDHESDTGANAQRIREELDTLHARLRETPTGFRDFWSHVRDVNTLFRELTPLGRDRREEHWRRLGTICALAKEQQQEHGRALESRESVSANKRSLVESKIYDASCWAKGGNTGEDLRKARDLLSEALEWMKNGWSGFNISTQLFAFDDAKMLKSDSDSCWEKWREAQQMLRSRRDEIANYHFEHYGGQAEEAIGIAEYDPKRAKEEGQGNSVRYARKDHNGRSGRGGSPTTGQGVGACHGKTT